MPIMGKTALHRAYTLWGLEDHTRKRGIQGALFRRQRLQQRVDTWGDGRSSRVWEGAPVRSVTGIGVTDFKIQSAVVDSYTVDPVFVMLVPWPFDSIRPLANARGAARLQSRER
jgi:hypothetical protein